jgi:hypothetical protein
MFFAILLSQIIPNSLKISNAFSHRIYDVLFLQEKEKDHEYWPPVDVHDHIAGKPRSNASADEEVSL